VSEPTVTLRDPDMQRALREALDEARAAETNPDREAERQRRLLRWVQSRSAAVSDVVS